jgi:PIN domain nuclease of toxin-antitoxin system
MATENLFVIDTHVLIWYFIGSKRLPRKLKDKIDEIRDQGGRLLVPTIVLAEALDIAEKGKVAFDFHKMHQLLQEEPEFEIIGFGTEIFDEVIHIDTVSELHDRIIVASARYFSAGILTKDRIILASGSVESL